MASPMPNLGAILKPLADAIKGLTGPVATFSRELVADLKSVTVTLADTGRAVVGFGSSVSSAVTSSLGGAISFVRILVSELASDIRTELGPAVSFAIDLFKELGSDIGGALVDMASWVGGKAAALFAPLKPGFDLVVSALGKVGSALLVVGAASVSGAASVAGFGVKIASGVSSALVTATGMAVTFSSKLITGFSAAIASTSQFVGSVAGMLKGMAEAGANALKQPFQVLDTLIGSMSQGITRFVALYDPGRVAVFQYAVDSLYAAIGQALAPAMDAVTQVVKALGSAISGAGEQGQMLIAAAASGAVALVAFAAAMALIETAASGGIVPIIGALIGALGGLEAVTGGLQPILDQLAPTLSGVMDIVGTALASVSGAVDAILPAIAKGVEFAASVVGMLASAFDSLGPAISGIVDVFMALMDAVKPMQELWLGILVAGVQLIGKVVASVAPYIVVFVQTMGDMVKKFIGWIREILSLIGIQLPEFDAEGPKGGTKNAPPPVRGTSTGDVESVLRRARESAFSLGGGGEKPEAKTADNTSSIRTSTDAIRQQMGGLINDVKQILRDAPIWITEVLPNKVYGYLIQVASMFPNFRDSAKQIEREAGEAARGERDAGRVGVDTPVGRIEAQDVMPGFRIYDWYARNVKGG